MLAQARLPGVRSSGRTPCEIHPESAAATAELWIAARDALEGVTQRDSSAPAIRVQQWRRTLDESLRLRWERRDTSVITTRHPFEKPAPGNLERAGYIQTRGGSTVFYGPDAGLLLSERFLRQHCFSRLEGDGANTGLTGLAFRPLPRNDRSDVAGVLWIDLPRAELRYVEYGWTNAPVEAQGPWVGGRAEFVRLESGGWIVQRWYIRMPKPDIGLGGGYDGYTEQGGEVLAVGSPRVRRN